MESLASQYASSENSGGVTSAQSGCTSNTENQDERPAFSTLPMPRQGTTLYPSELSSCVMRYSVAACWNDAPPT